VQINTSPATALVANSKILGQSLAAAWPHLLLNFREQIAMCDMFWRQPFPVRPVSASARRILIVTEFDLPQSAHWAKDYSLKWFHSEGCCHDH
jgi:hypothetical protein